MASIEAASALLTAQSILVAAFSIGLQHLPTPDDESTSSTRRPIAIITALLTAISFLASLAYLHAAELPHGMIAELANDVEFLSVSAYFNIAISSLLAIVYIGIFLMYMEYIFRQLRD